jgi:hypothetical protein
MAPDDRAVRSNRMPPGNDQAAIECSMLKSGPPVGEAAQRRTKTHKDTDNFLVTKNP